ncbi:EpsG family protein [Salipaludibacillus sp. HK11]|uniref:EpsG family protein n=1 Tax=Salipaludibacillus sp. HK11 TaxID=3394320 RepID=UPI0039FBFAAB
MIFSTALTGWVYLISSTPQNSIINNRYNVNFVLFCVWSYISLTLFFSEINTVDMPRYVHRFLSYENMSFSTLMRIADSEYLFLISSWLLSKVVATPNVYHVFIWVLVSALLIYSLNKLTSSWEKMILFYTYSVFFLTANFATNVIQQGVAASLLLAASILLIKKEKSFLFFVFIVSAPLFHFSALPLSLILFVMRKYNFKLKTFILLWSLAAFTYITGLNANLANLFTSFIPYIDIYSSQDRISGYGNVNRFDFLIFSFTIFIISFYSLKKFLKNSELYTALLKVYLVFNTMFLLTGFLAYSDRTAAYSWFFIPLLIWYPIFKSNHPSIVKYKVTLSLILLTLFVGFSFVTQSLMFF